MFSSATVCTVNCWLAAWMQFRAYWAIGTASLFNPIGVAMYYGITTAIAAPFLKCYPWSLCDWHGSPALEEVREVISCGGHNERCHLAHPFFSRLTRRWTTFAAWLAARVKIRRPQHSEDAKWLCSPRVRRRCLVVCTTPLQVHTSSLSSPVQKHIRPTTKPCSSRGRFDLQKRIFENVVRFPHKWQESRENE